MGARALDEVGVTTVAELVADLRGDDGQRRGFAADRLGRLPRDERVDAVGSLFDALELDPSPTIRRAAAWALVRASPVDARWLPRLLDTLKSAHPDVRAWACALVGESGVQDPRLRTVLEALVESDADSEVRWRAAAALRDLDGSPGG